MGGKKGKKKRGGGDVDLTFTAARSGSWDPRLMEGSPQVCLFVFFWFCFFPPSQTGLLPRHEKEGERGKEKGGRERERIRIRKK